VHSLEPDGAAAISGMVEVGDVFYAINDVAVYKSPHHVVSGMLLGTKVCRV
jgi:hypothetical protein